MNIKPLFSCLFVVGKLGGFFCVIAQLFAQSSESRIKSPHQSPIKKTGAINQSIKKVITYIDSIVLEYEGVTTKDYLTKT